MSVHWGFHCKDCNVDSRRWFDDPRKLRLIYTRAGENFKKVWGDRPLRLPTMEIEPLFFLAEHYEHELWVQCELAQLQLNRIAEPEPLARAESKGAIAGVEDADETSSTGISFAAPPLASSGSFQLTAPR